MKSLHHDSLKSTFQWLIDCGGCPTRLYSDFDPKILEGTTATFLCDKYIILHGAPSGHQNQNGLVECGGVSDSRLMQGIALGCCRKSDGVSFYSPHSKKLYISSDYKLDGVDILLLHLTFIMMGGSSLVYKSREIHQCLNLIPKVHQILIQYNLLPILHLWCRCVALLFRFPFLLVIVVYLLQILKFLLMLFTW